MQARQGHAGMQTRGQVIFYFSILKMYLLYVNVLCCSCLFLLICLLCLLIFT